MQQVREREVVDVSRAAGHLVRAFFAKDVAADGPRRTRHLADYMSGGIGDFGAVTRVCSGLSRLELLEVDPVDLDALDGLPRESTLASGLVRPPATSSLR